MVALVSSCAGGSGSIAISRPAPTASSPLRTSSTTTTVPLAAASSASTGAATTTTALPSPSIRWRRCGGGLQCGLLTVPLDYADPAKGTIELNVERRLARKQSERIGSLLVDPGGPGVPGTVLTEQASTQFSDDLLDRFDIVGWDPRGTGRSAPLDCTDDLDPFLVALDPTPANPAAVQALQDASRAFISGCEARSGALLPYVSTEASARDMDRIRQALGETKISYFGFSYGSELGATWATLFPSTVRAAVLDGALDPNATWEDQTGQQLAGLQLGFTHAMDGCAADSVCPFFNGGDPIGAFGALATSLDARPLVVDPHRPPVNQSLLFYAVSYALRDRSQWDELYHALADAQAGKGDRLYALYDAYVGRHEDGSFPNTLESFVAISCLDESGPTDPSLFPAIDARLKQIAPDMDFGAGYNYTCGEWPVRSAPRIELTAKGAGPIVVVGTTGDPITPLESSRRLARDLEHGVLLTVDGERHTGYRINACSRRTVDAYLISRTPPPPGTVCA